MAKGNVKSYNATNRTSPQLRGAIQNTLKSNEYHKKAFFWQPAKSETERLLREFQFRLENPPYRIQMGKDNIEVIQWYTESPSQVFYRLNVNVNGTRKDVRVLKNILQPTCINKMKNSIKSNK